MIKVSDFIFQHLVEKYGIKHCFLVTGGGAMHLNDSIGHTKGLKYWCSWTVSGFNPRSLYLWSD